MRRSFMTLMATLGMTLAGCSSQDDGATTSGASTGASVPGGPAAGAAGAAGSARAATATGGATAAADIQCTDYRSDMEPGDMVMIYHAISGIAPPVDKWAESILYKFDRTVDPEGAWKQANQQIKAQYDAVTPVRCITLRTNAGIRNYDPSRRGLIIGSFSPDTY